VTEIDDTASHEAVDAQTPDPTTAASPQRPSRQAEALRAAAADGQKALDLYQIQQAAVARNHLIVVQAQSAAAELVHSPALQASRSIQESVAAIQRMYTSPIVELVESMNRRNAARLGESARIARSIVTDPAIATAAKSVQQTQAALTRLAVPPFREITLLAAMPRLPQALFKPAWPVADIMRQLPTAGFFDPGTLNPMVGFTAELHRLLRSWWRISSSTEQLLARLARAGFLAALRARDAAVRGETGPVVDFISEWLGMKLTGWRIEAVAAALLEDGWDEQPGEVLTEIGARARRQRRALRPVWDTKLGGRPVGLLGEPVDLGDGSPGTMADLITDHTRTEEIALFGHVNRPIHIVLDQLKPAERAVALAFAVGIDGIDGIGNQWTAAAAQAGVEDPEAYGRRVYRKVRRLGVLYIQRHCDLEY
jgi:hypothetical protein